MNHGRCFVAHGPNAPCAMWHDRPRPGPGLGMSCTPFFGGNLGGFSIMGLFGLHAWTHREHVWINTKHSWAQRNIHGGRCRTVRARCAHGACTVRAQFNVFGMVA